jgi:hypothetical protein
MWHTTKYWPGNQASKTYKRSPIKVISTNPPGEVIQSPISPLYLALLAVQKSSSSVHPFISLFLPLLFASFLLHRNDNRNWLQPMNLPSGFQIWSVIWLLFFSFLFFFQIAPLVWKKHSIVDFILNGFQFLYAEILYTERKHTCTVEIT